MCCHLRSHGFLLQSAVSRCFLGPCVYKGCLKARSLVAVVILIVIFGLIFNHLKQFVSRLLVKVFQVQEVAVLFFAQVQGVEDVFKDSPAVVDVQIQLIGEVVCLSRE